MKAFVSLLVVIGALVGLTGCHSGTMRGAGADVEHLGKHMQR